MLPLLKRSPLLLILLLATFLRFHRLDAQSFWNDEGNSARLAERSPQLILEGAAGDIHPPGYYLLLAAWRSALGQSEFALRGLSALAGIILVALIYQLGRRYFDSHAARFAAFVAAVSPPLIYYSQEARMYELAGLWAGAVFWIISPMLSHPASGAVRDYQANDRRRWLGAALVVAAGLYTHYAFAFSVIALNLLFGVRLCQWLALNHWRRSPLLTTRLTGWFAIQLLALLLFSPWLPVALRQITSWPAGREYLPIDQALMGIAHWLTLGVTIDAAIDTAMLIGLAALLGLSFWRSRRLEPALWLLVPTALTAMFGLHSAVFAKVLIVAVPALCLLAGNGLAAIRRAADAPPEMAPARRALQFIQPFILLPILLPTLGLPLAVSLNNLYNNPAYGRADYRAIARYLDTLARPGDAILLNAPNQWEVFTYYHPDLSNVFPVARSRPLNVPEQVAELEAITADHDRLFVLYWGEAQADPDRVIETWLNEHTFKAYDQWYANVRLAVYAVPQTAGELQTRTDINFGDQIDLLGYGLNASAFSPGDILQLTLFWQQRTDSLLTTRYKVFVHLIGDPAQPPVAQHDGEPGGGSTLTTTWQPDQLVADNHGVFLPLDLPPGEYSLVVGLYNIDDTVRLTHPGGDSVLLTTITVR